MEPIPSIEKLVPKATPCNQKNFVCARSEFKKGIFLQFTDQPDVKLTPVNPFASFNYSCCVRFCSMDKTLPLSGKEGRVRVTSVPHPDLYQRYLIISTDSDKNPTPASDPEPFIHKQKEFDLYNFVTS